jgi:CRISPR/Cas system-associated endonuclease Cas3-HD
MSQTYDPNWNPDEYDMTLKYEPMNSSKISDILTRYKNEPVLDYIKDLWKLIDYQKQEIWKQRKEIISVKHKIAWKHYDKEIDYADPVNRVNTNKPKRTDTMGC